MSQLQKYPVVWKGAALGAFSIEEIQQKLSTGEFCRIHQIGTRDGWISLGEFLDSFHAIKAAESKKVRQAEEAQLRAAYEEKLQKAQAREAALQTHLETLRKQAGDQPLSVTPQAGRPAPWQISPSPAEGTPPRETLGVLRCTSGPDAGTSVPIGSTLLSFGSSPGCSISSRDPSVASHHANLVVSGGTLCVDRSSPSAVLLTRGKSIARSEFLPNGEQLQMGSSIWIFESFSLDPRNQHGGLADAVSRLVGVDSIGGFSFSETFSHVFTSHSDEETELNLACGTIATTPSIDQISPAFPQPWMFVRTLGISLGAFWLLKFCWSEFGRNDKLIPGLIILGALATPASMLVLFFESNKPRNVSVYQLLKLVIGGGVASILFSEILAPVIADVVIRWFHLDPNKNNLSWIAGLVEEPAKMLVLCWMANKQRYVWTLNGMLFGAAVGTGFAVFETAGYAFSFLLEGGRLDYETMFTVLLVRGILTPFGGHALMTAIAGAGLWRSKRGGPLEMRTVLSRRFLGPFCLAVGMHALWNSGLDFGLFLGIFPIKQLAIGLVGWIVVIGLIREGLREISAKRSQI